MKRENLIKARKNGQYTQKGLAELLGVTERHYQRLEAGTSKGSVDVWERLKALLDAPSIDYLLKVQEKGCDNSPSPAPKG